MAKWTYFPIIILETYVDEQVLAENVTDYMGVFEDYLDLRPASTTSDAASIIEQAVAELAANDIFIERAYIRADNNDYDPHSPSSPNEPDEVDLPVIFTVDGRALPDIPHGLAHILGVHDYAQAGTPVTGQSDDDRAIESLISHYSWVEQMSINHDIDTSEHGDEIHHLTITSRDDPEVHARVVLEGGEKNPDFVPHIYQVLSDVLASTPRIVDLLSDYHTMFHEWSEREEQIKEHETRIEELEEEVSGADDRISELEVEVEEQQNNARYYEEQADEWEESARTATDDLEREQDMVYDREQQLLALIREMNQGLWDDPVDITDALERIFDVRA